MDLSIVPIAGGRIQALLDQIAGLGWQTLDDVDFTAEANLDVKALGDGNQTVAGLPVTLVTVANVTSLNIVNGTGLVFDGGAGPTAFRLRLADMAGEPGDGVPRIYRVTIYSSIAGLAGVEDAWLYFMQASGTVVTGFSWAATKFYSLPGVDLGVLGSTAVARISYLFGGTLLEAGAALASMTRRGFTGGTPASGAVWASEVPTFDVSYHTGPYTWTVSRIKIEYRNIE